MIPYIGLYLIWSWRGEKWAYPTMFDRLNEMGMAYKEIHLKLGVN